MNFEMAIRAEFATLHLLHEEGIKSEGPLDLYLKKGYDLMIYEPKKWEQIQKLYELQIRKCLKDGVGNKKCFRFIELKEGADE